MSKVTEISKDYFEINPTNVVESLEQIDAPIQEEIIKPYNENVTDISKSDLISRVFENKTKTLIDKKELARFDKGGATNEDQEVWTPYEFLHELMPTIYGKSTGFNRYVVSDKEAEKIYSELSEEQRELDTDLAKALESEGVLGLYELSSEVFEQFEVRRKTIEGKSTFISESELQAYVLTNPDLVQENYVKKITAKKEDLIESGLILLDLSKNETKWVYRYQYLSGNIQAKISDMAQKIIEYKEHLSEDQFNRQVESLNNARNPLARITVENQNKIFIHPNSDFATDKANFTVNQDDYAFFEDAYADYDLKTAFIGWLNKSGEVFPTDYQVTKGAKEVIQYYVNGSNPATDNDRLNMNLMQNAQADGERLFESFLTRGLNESCKQRLEAVWNAKYNNLVLPKLYKIPVALTLAKEFRDGSPFIPNPTQIQSVQFMRNSGSGLLAYGVGVGKTASSILNVSFALDNGLAKKPLMVVPNPTFPKWIIEMSGGFVTSFRVTYTENGESHVSVFNNKKDASGFAKAVNGTIEEKTEYMKGLLPHLPPIVPLHNLNLDIVKSILKTYSPEEKAEMELMHEFKSYLSTIPYEYNFENPTINAKIKEYYDDFEIENVRSAYERYQDTFGTYYYGNDKAKKGEWMLPMFKWWLKSVLAYIKELPYRTGETTKFPDNTIFLLTHEGLSNLGAESLLADQRDSINSDTSMFGTLFKELSQGESISAIRGGNGLVLADLLEDAMFGGVGSPKIYLKDLEIDYAVFDESHFFKQLYTESKGKPSDRSDVREDGRVHRETRKYNIGKGGKPSTRALGAFVAVRYVQLNNNNRNVIHLTATPFTNNPIEVYSMLAITNYQQLVDSGYRWVDDFYDVFMKMSFDLRYTASQQIRKEEVLAGYNNAPQMRSLIYFLMDYKSGEDANIKRPVKFQMPNYRYGVETIIPAHPQQKEAFDLIKDYIRGEKSLKEICDSVADDISVPDMADDQLLSVVHLEGSAVQIEKWSNATLPLDEVSRLELEKIVQKIVDKNIKDSQSEGETQEDAAFIKILRGLSMLKQVTLSPYLFSCRKSGGKEPTYKEYVETSPKILYSLKCIKSGHDFERKHQPYKGLVYNGKEAPQLSGSVIYMNLGVSPKSVDKKINKDTGEEIVTVTKWQQGGFEKIKEYLIKEMGYEDRQVVFVKGGMSAIMKEKAKNKFLSGEALILIGSSTISTGIDLQNNASSLFLCTYDWNPTDNEQINGRIHRQGSRFGKIRSVYPMIENSADPIIFQFLEEKTQRVKEIWDREGRSSALDLRDFNPSDLKKKLITAPRDKVRYWLNEQLKEIEDEEILLQNRLDALRSAGSDFDNLEKLREPVRGVLTVIDAFKKDKIKKEAQKAHENKTQELVAQFASKPTELVKELEKINKGIYDHQVDPDGRYTPIDLSKADDDELFAKVNNWIKNTESWWNKNKNWELVEAINTFTSNTYPNYYKGIWATDDVSTALRNKATEKLEAYDKLNLEYSTLEDEQSDIEKAFDWDALAYEKDAKYIAVSDRLATIFPLIHDLEEELHSAQRDVDKLVDGERVRFDQYGGIISKANDWSVAKRGADKQLEILSILGVKVDSIREAQQTMVDRIADINMEKDTINSKYQEMFEFFQKEALENIATAPSIDERVQEFASYNAEFLGRDSQLATFAEDIAPVAEEVPVQETPKRLKKEVEKPTDKKQFLKDKIEAFEMMLDITKDADKKEFLEMKIEAFGMMLDAQK